MIPLFPPEPNLAKRGLTPFRYLPVSLPADKYSFLGATHLAGYDNVAMGSILGQRVGLDGTPLSADLQRRFYGATPEIRNGNGCGCSSNTQGGARSASFVSAVRPNSF